MVIVTDSIARGIHVAEWTANKVKEIWLRKYHSECHRRRTFLVNATPYTICDVSINSTYRTDYFHLKWSLDLQCFWEQISTQPEARWREGCRICYNLL